MTEEYFRIGPESFRRGAALFGTPFYLYDEQSIRSRCAEALAVSNPFGLCVRYSIKANPSRAVIQLTRQAGLSFDASSINEVRRLVAAKIAPDRILLTGREVPVGSDGDDLERLLPSGLLFCAGSLRQVAWAAPIAGRLSAPLYLRIHLSKGNGESASRNTGGPYASFGIAASDLEAARKRAARYGARIVGLHAHTGSGGDPALWSDHIDTLLEAATRFADVTVVNLGGGFKVARAPGERETDIAEVGDVLHDKLTDFYQRTGRKLRVEIEPGTFIVAKSGYLVTRIIDTKRIGKSRFLVTDAGMNANLRPALYNATHPMAIIGSTEGRSVDRRPKLPQLVVGPCCETGDTQCETDAEGRIIPRLLPQGRVGDLLVVGGCGAYCASMSPSSYNSQLMLPEALLRTDGSLLVIRNRQTLAQSVENEVGLP